MGTIKYYKKLYEHIPAIRQPSVVKDVEEVFSGKPILNDAKLITLAEYDVDTKDAITAHHLRDYRRRSFSLVLLPKIDILYDRLLEGSEYWNELLHHESPYS